MKGGKGKKKHGRSHAKGEVYPSFCGDQVTGAGLNTASWLCNPH